MEEKSLELSSKKSQETAVVQTAEKQKEVEVAVILANKFPRNESKAYEKLMAACERYTFAQNVTYSFPRGGSKVSGPSIHIAREAARCYGNLRYGLCVVHEDTDSITIEAWAWDIETNTRISQEDKFKKLIYRKSGGWIEPDERDLRELVNRRGAIVLRNCLLQIIPKDFIDDAISLAAKTILSKASQSPDEQLKAMQSAFKKDFNVTVDMLEKYLDHKISECGPEEIVDLRGVYNSLKDGNSKRDDYFKADTKPFVETPKAKKEKKPETKKTKPSKEETAKRDKLVALVYECIENVGGDSFIKKVVPLILNDKGQKKAFPGEYDNDDLEKAIKLMEGIKT